MRQSEPTRPMRCREDRWSAPRRRALAKLAQALLLPLVFGAAGCGTVVPHLTERLDVSDDLAGELLVQAIVASVRCELRNGVTAAVNEDVGSAPTSGGRTYSDFLDKWGAEVALTITIVEKTAVSPDATLVPSMVVAVAGGVSVTARATRLERINLFYTVKDLYLRRGETCVANEDPSGSFLIRNDLRIASILRSRINTIALGKASAAGSPNTLQHQVTFQTIYDGNVTPTVRLSRATVNPAGPLFDASRDRTHDLTITFGPTSAAGGGRSLIAIAEEAHTIAQINSGFRTALPQAQ